MLLIRTRTPAAGSPTARHWLTACALLLGTTAWAQDRPNPSDCVAKPQGKPVAAMTSCSKHWCDYYACSAKQGHAQCKRAARVALRVCTLAQDPTAEVPEPIRPAGVSPFGSAAQ